MKMSALKCGIIYDDSGINSVLLGGGVPVL